MSKSKSTGHARHLFALGSVILLITVFGLYGAHYVARVSNVGPVIDDKIAWQPAAAENDPWTLHPEQHVFRDAKTILVKWNITLGQRAPDGVTRPVYSINGQFPGPTIETRSGDELVVEVQNSLENDEDLAIHWHGLSMKGANEMDGVIGLTQCAIGKSESFTYRFRIGDEQSGTFWYHAHSSVQRADGLYGGLIIHKPAVESTSELSTYQYEREQLLLIGDWYHRRANTVLDWFEDFSHFGNEPAPDSLLINGRGYFNCSMAVRARPVDCEPVSVPKVTLEGNRIRLRVVNTGALTGFTLSVPQAGMRVIQVDGGNPVTKTPRAESVGVLYPGERLDLIAERTSDESATPSTLIVSLDRENLKFKNFALTPKQSFPISWKGNAPSQFGRSESVAHFDLADISGPTVNIPESPSETSVFYSRIEILAIHGNAPLGVVNHTSWAIKDSKARPLLALGRSEWETKAQPGEIQTYVPWYGDSGEEKWMEIVLNNLDEKGHPFHLIFKNQHGYDFYIVSSHRSPRGRYEAYNPFDTSVAPAGGPMNTVNPVRKDTVYVPRMGYVVLRFPMANDGLWLLHCHTLWHQAVGMGIAIQIGDYAALEGVKERAGALCSR